MQFALRLRVFPRQTFQASSRVFSTSSATMNANKNFRVSLVQLGHTSSKKQENLDRAAAKVREAAQQSSKPDLIVLPECFNSPYGVDHFNEYSEIIGTSLSNTKSETVKHLSSLAKELGVWLVGGSIPERDQDNKLYNTSTVYSRAGDLVAMHRKVHLFDIDIPGGISFQESKVLTGGNQVTLFDTEFGRFGLGICYDMRFPELAMIAARQGAAAMIYPGAFNTTTGPPYWELLQKGRAVDNQLYIISCSPARPTGAGYPAYGYSMVVDPTGKVAATAAEEETIVSHDIDMELLQKTRTNIPISKQRRFDVYADVAKTKKA